MHSSTFLLSYEDKIWKIIASARLLSAPCSPHRHPSTVYLHCALGLPFAALICMVPHAGEVRVPVSTRFLIKRPAFFCL